MSKLASPSSDLAMVPEQGLNPTAIGLLKMLKKPGSIGFLYILKGVLPVLSTLSKVFQKGSIFFSHISPVIKASKDSLNSLVQKNITFKEFQKETQLENLLA